MRSIWPAIFERVEQRDVVALLVWQELFERKNRGAADLEQQGVVLFDRDAERLCHLIVFGHPGKPVLELDKDSFEFARFLAHGTWHPIERAQGVEDRTIDARDGISLELHAT